MFGAFEMKLRVESFKLMEKYILCDYYCYYWFWPKGILCSHRSTAEDQILLSCFVSKS